jgi:hypothetical protein
MKDEALQMCLEYIETDAHERKYVRHAIKQALAAPVQEPAQQEPVACIWEKDDGYKSLEWEGLEESEMQNVNVKSITPLYTTPPAQRQWVGLTDEDVKDLCGEASNFGTSSWIRHIEAKLRSKNI